MIHTLPETEVFNRLISSYDKKAATFPLWMLADLKGTNAGSNLLLGFRMALIYQVQKYHMLILEERNTKHSIKAELEQKPSL